MSKKPKKEHVKYEKLKRKDKFKRKRGKVECSRTPSFLNTLYGVTAVTQSGIFQTVEDFSKVYKVVVDATKVDRHAAYMIMRNYDIVYRFYYIKNDVYMMIYLPAEKNKKMYDFDLEFTNLEKDMFAKLKQTGIYLSNVPFEERMKLIHDFITDKETTVLDYYKNILSWKNDFEMKSFKTKENKQLLRYADDSEEPDRIYGMLFIKKVDSEYVQDLVEAVSNIDGVAELSFEFQAVADQAVGEFIRQNYLDCERELNKIGDPDLLDVYRGKVTDEDKRRFCMTGIYILLKAETEVDYSAAEKALDFILKRFDAKYEYCYGDAKKMFIDFVPFTMKYTCQTRLNNNHDAEIYFLPGYINDNNISNVVDEPVTLVDSEKDENADDVEKNNDSVLESSKKTVDELLDDNEDEIDLNDENINEDEYSDDDLSDFML